MGKNETFVHSSAIVHPKARLDLGVWVGPHSFVGQNVIIKKDTKLDGNVYINGWTEIGEGNHFSPFCSIGNEPQDLTYKGEKTKVKIGDRNIFREFITIHRGTAKGRKETVVGNDSYFMAYSHIAHDCTVGSETVFTHGATLGGHVTIDDYATVGALSGVHQFCRVGKHAFIGGYSVITQDVLSYCRVAGGRPTLLYGLNAIGLRRRGFSRERLRNLKEMFKIIFYSDLNTSQALAKIKEQFQPGEDRDEILAFIQSSKRGIIKKVAEKWDSE